MAFTKDDINKNDVWDKKDLLECTYEPGMLLKTNSLFSNYC